jgi:hypothetical protein
MAVLIFPIILTIIVMLWFRFDQLRPRIKGNINKKGEKIYHLPCDRFYAVTKIDKRKGEMWFLTETEALEHGFKRTKVR